MTPRERITAAFRNERPDRVPVSPELWDVIPIRVSGRPFHEFSGTSYGKTPLWRAQLEAYRFFGCEAWIPVEAAPSRRQSGMLEARSRFVHEELIETRVSYRTSRGELHEVRHSAPDYDLWSIDPPVRDLPRDLPLIEEYFFENPEELDYSPISAAYEETGEAGICEGIVGNTFFEFLTLNRRGGAVQAILDLYEHPDYLKEVQGRYVAHLSGIAEEICRRTPVEGIFLNCGSASLNIVSPQLFREWDIPVVQAVAAVARRHDRVFHYHLHGRGRKLLEELVEAGIGMICPLECPPKGDFVLREVKAGFGDRLALKGGVDPFVLRDAAPRKIETIVLRCLGDAADGGGYTLASGDGVLKETPFESIRLLVELAHRHGSYR
jgi:hypothetical protein